MLRRTQEERTEATRDALIAAGRDVFARDGYADARTAEISKLAQVTRGALYHHFDGKPGLFRAVHEALERDLVAAVTRRAAAETDPLAVIAAGLGAFLDNCEDPAFARIALVEAPSVLGWAELREVDSNYALGLVDTALSTAMDAGLLRRQPVRPLAHLLVAAIAEAGLMIAADGDRQALERSLLSLLDGLRA
jgi:AcrR family transcriptional regulator